MVRENGGRPHRSSVLALLLDLPVDGWKVWDRQTQTDRLMPFVLEGESIRFATQDDEAFIVPDAVGRVDSIEQSASADLSLDEVKAQAAARAHWEEMWAKHDRQSAARGYVQATAHMAPMFVELEEKILSSALGEDASEQQMRLALQLTKDWKDRVMGKAVAPTEDVTQRPSDVKAWMSTQAPKQLPVSSLWTEESIAQDQLRELEAGTLAEGEI